jgi:hypothetical protein
MNLSHIPAREPGVADLPHLLTALGVCKESLIQITGPDGLGALLWFCRHGFEHAAYVKCGAPCPSEPADTLIAPHAMSPEALIALLDSAPKVRPGGALIVQALRSAAESTDELPALLERFGYRITARFDRGDRELIAARRVASTYARAA